MDAYPTRASPLRSVPHVAVRAGCRALGTIAIEDGKVLAGAIPPKILRRVRKVLDQHRDAALEAFAAGLAHGEVVRLEDTLRKQEEEEIDD